MLFVEGFARRRFVLAVVLFFASSITAAQAAAVFTITPEQGLVQGGTEVRIGRSEPLPPGPYEVYFGSHVVPATALDGNTLVALTPLHLPGPVEVFVRTGAGSILPTGRIFTYEGDPEEAFDRILLPVFTYPVQGSFGTVFRSDLRATLANGDVVDIYGLARQCRVLCIEDGDQPHRLTKEHPTLGFGDIEPSGTPGQFIYVPRDHRGRVAMHLRAYDTSRSAENYGTEIPIVPAERFFRSTETIALTGIPSDPRFRNMLRIYTIGEAAGLQVLIEGSGTTIDHTVYAPASPDLFHPGYVELSNFPIGIGELTIRIHQLIEAPIGGAPVVWAFVSVTNNETQHITTVTPQP